MTEVFADTQYWVAAADRRDPWRRAALVSARGVRSSSLVTTEEVLVEVLGFLGSLGDYPRAQALRLVKSLLTDARVEIIHQSHESFLRGLDLYERRTDKGYSLVDCISMVVMRERGITDVLSGDQHFRQEGFVPLLDPDAA